MNEIKLIDSMSSEILEQKEKTFFFFFKKKSGFVLTPDEMELKVMMIEELIRQMEESIRVTEIELNTPSSSKWELEETSVKLTKNNVAIQKEYLNNIKFNMTTTKNIIQAYRNNENYNTMLENVLKLQKNNQ